MPVRERRWERVVRREATEARRPVMAVATGELQARQRTRSDCFGALLTYVYYVCFHTAGPSTAGRLGARGTRRTRRRPRRGRPGPDRERATRVIAIQARCKALAMRAGTVKLLEMLRNEP